MAPPLAGTAGAEGAGAAGGAAGGAAAGAGGAGAAGGAAGGAGAVGGQASRPEAASALSAPAPSSSPELSFEVLEELPEHLAGQLLELSADCGWGHYDLQKWRFLLACCSELIAVRRPDGAVAACALRTSCPPAAGGGGGGEVRGFGMLGMMLVHPDLRGRGLAGRLLALFRERAEGAGELCGLGCATAVGLPVYLKHGYAAASPDAACCKLSAIGSAAAGLSLPDAGVEVALHADAASSPDALDKLLALDQYVTGFDRAKQLRVFSSLPGAFLAIASHSGRSVGALLGILDSQTGALSLGPILGTEASATALLAAVGRGNPGESLAFYASDHHGFVERLKAAGFDEVTRLTGTMTLGGIGLPGDRSRYIGFMHPSLG